MFNFLILKKADQFTITQRQPRCLCIPPASVHQSAHPICTNYYHPKATSVFVHTFWMKTFSGQTSAFECRQIINRILIVHSTFHHQQRMPSNTKTTNQQTSSLDSISFSILMVPGTRHLVLSFSLYVEQIRNQIQMSLVGPSNRYQVPGTLLRSSTMNMISPTMNMR